MKRTTRTSSVVVALVAAAGLFVPSAALAAGRPLTTEMSGANEVPPADPDGSGTARVWVNPGLNEVCYELTVADIAPAVAAHIHVAPVGVNGPIVVPLAAPTTGSSSGCADVSRELAQALVMHPENYYVNVHNADYPGGAIRGQLS
ncbi:CHRD domain-containing protein [Terrabacter sp. MAHUQ-38]|uniref:CHRD domain-containing protein n=1 Tax=unclassified Terrabacter TaxID=2630222 RepID=UPI00165DA6B1|nr:CHRD domain-containing protein [Terrabacter sp. MAHUQ-38]MBC9820662.1 CHRD domain-containing protein [Terrabacter sp. MAHUQ-38]